ncbi:MAG: hypothetical protein AVDCRST_MAG64-2860, partial [uncultured Phycisphaerae bacterium]
VTILASTRADRRVAPPSVRRRRSAARPRGTGGPRPGRTEQRRPRRIALRMDRARVADHRGLLPRDTLGVQESARRAV